MVTSFEYSLIWNNFCAEKYVGLLTVVQLSNVKNIIEIGFLLKASKKNPLLSTKLTYHIHSYPHPARHLWVDHLPRFPVLDSLRLYGAPHAFSSSQSIPGHLGLAKNIGRKASWNPKFSFFANRRKTGRNLLGDYFWSNYSDLTRPHLKR